MPAAMSKQVSPSKPVKKDLKRKDAPPPDAPKVPDGFPDTYRAKRCRRCGHWSTETCPYKLTKAMEAVWNGYLPWEQGSLHDPRGCHCSACRKALLTCVFHSLFNLLSTGCDGLYKGYTLLLVPCA